VHFIIEIATNDFVTTKAAVDGGADRIELCGALSEGGITPSYGIIKNCREAFTTQLFPIIRPRGGDFLYTEQEFMVMLDDVKKCKELGCDGVVIGLLDKQGNIDTERTARLIDEAYPLRITFHRAFDRCNDPFLALEQLIKLGCERILTSGQKPNVMDGIELVTQLIAAANGRIIIMPGSGVRKENIQELAGKTGAIEFHSSLRGKASSEMDFIHPEFAGSMESYSNPSLSPVDVIDLRTALNS
jgi:copper homeostasis protein